MFFWDGAAEINNVSQASPDDSNLYYGAGASYAVTERFSLNADWSRYDLEESQSDVLSAGFQYRFGGCDFGARPAMWPGEPGLFRKTSAEALNDRGSFAHLVLQGGPFSGTARQTGSLRCRL